MDPIIILFLVGLIVGMLVMGKRPATPIILQVAPADPVSAGFGWFPLLIIGFIAFVLLMVLGA